MEPKSNPNPRTSDKSSFFLIAILLGLVMTIAVLVMFTPEDLDEACAEDGKYLLRSDGSWGCGEGGGTGGNVFQTDFVVENVTYDQGILNISMCELSFTVGVLTYSSCGTGNNNTLGVSNNYTFINNVTLYLGIMEVRTCMMNFSNGLLNGSDCDE